MLDIDTAIKHCEEVAELNEMYCDSADSDSDRVKCAADHRQLAEWLMELKEWKENPFRRIKAECKENYYCNNCAFIDHCPFLNGNRVAAEYPMDWVIY